MSRGEKQGFKSHKLLAEMLDDARQKMEFLSCNESEESLKCALDQLQKSIANLSDINLKTLDGNKVEICDAEDSKNISDNNNNNICDNNIINNSNNNSSSNDENGKLLIQDLKFQSSSFESLDDLVGLESVKQVLREALVLPEMSPQLFESKIRSPWNIILLYGPPGTGKSSLVDALASESQCNVLRITCADLLSSWFGESEK